MAITAFFKRPIFLMLIYFIYHTFWSGFIQIRYKSKNYLRKQTYVNFRNYLKNNKRININIIYNSNFNL
jgi:hypothetical protein